MSYILRNVHADQIQAWVKANAPSQLKATARQSWISYLAANGGTGNGPQALEMSFLKAAGCTGKTMYDLWSSYGVTAGQSGMKIDEKLKGFYK